MMGNGYIEPQKCNYGTCKEDATTTGSVFTKLKTFVVVHACDKHKKKPGFFEIDKGVK